jgi:hypothetical protein
VDPRLNGIRAKLDRAKVHLRAEHDEETRFLKQNPLQTIGGFDPQTGLHVERLKPLPPLPPIFAVIVGDYIHDLRSALDHLAWRLVATFGKRKPGRHTAFPIYTDEDDFVCEIERPALKERRSPLLGLNPSSQPWALIEGRQPYRQPDPPNHPLELIRTFNNVDKHRTLFASYIQIDKTPDLRSMFTWPAEVGEPVEQAFHLRAGDRMEEGAEVASFRFPRPGPLDSGVVMKGKLDIAIQFSDGQGGAAGQSLYDLGAYVEEVFDQAQRLFREH